MSLLLIVVAIVSLSSAQDPAGSWLTYAKAQVPGVMLKFFYAEATVPPYPTLPGSSAAWWIGVEDQVTQNVTGSCQCDLRQPIMIKHGFGYSSFVERYDWYTGEDYQSSAITVKPGQKVFGLLQLQPNGKDYLMSSGIVNTSSVVSYVIQSDANDGVSSIAWIVLEHQPSLCAQLPPSNGILFDNITAVWVDGSTAPWTAHTHAPACGSATKVLSQQKVAMVWQS